MKNKDHTLPKNVIAPEFEDFDKISFYANSADVNNDKVTNLTLPKWFGELIKSMVEDERQQAVSEFKIKVRDMFI